MLIEQIIDFELRGPGPLGRTCTPKTGYFHDKTKISKAKRSSSESLFTAKNIAGGNVPQRWKPVGLPVGSRFFDRPVKPVEKLVKFSFLATKRHLSTNRNIPIYFIINKTFCKKTVFTNHIFQKHLLNGFKL